MLRLADKIRQRQQGQISNEPDSVSSPSIRNASIRDRLLAQELTDLKSNLSQHCRLRYPDPDKLHEFEIIISPVDGFWAKGHFHFEFTVPEGYNHVPPIVKCTTRIWHPNIDEEGRICLSLLRPSSLDSSGWAPTRKLSDVIWGLESLFSDLCDFNDALNTNAAEEYIRDPESFKRTLAYVHTGSKPALSGTVSVWQSKRPQDPSHPKPPTSNECPSEAHVKRRVEVFSTASCCNRIFSLQGSRILWFLTIFLR
ncbi:NEDD8-conjugating enzyme UBE2F [Echinococcus granulosus]|uniref:E2 NEDD8-conjugating enzyme n=1 Tax=Echinococcus granulosus TaxID=6210 RepID=W6V1M1_ECHGR|nr:NEDD8-conjugating enzyme UBE2F [Echinococcus granulosus]EUB64842.1 NEDD8-conjugating enzyme UBE2F [Echinococcus granulosus]